MFSLEEVILADDDNDGDDRMPFDGIYQCVSVCVWVCVCVWGGRLYFYFNWRFMLFLFGHKHSVLCVLSRLP